MAAKKTKTAHQDVNAALEAALEALDAMPSGWEYAQARTHVTIAKDWLAKRVEVDETSENGDTENEVDETSENGDTENEVDETSENGDTENGD